MVVAIVQSNNSVSSTVALPFSFTFCNQKCLKSLKFNGLGPPKFAQFRTPRARSTKSYKFNRLGPPNLLSSGPRELENVQNPPNSIAPKFAQFLTPRARKCPNSFKFNRLGGPRLGVRDSMMFQNSFKFNTQLLNTKLCFNM